MKNTRDKFGWAPQVGVWTHQLRMRASNRPPGIFLAGGDRATLTPAAHTAENCHIHHYSRWDPMYKPGVQLRGVGNRVSHCLIQDAPHTGISTPGNDHLVEYNECHSLVYLSNDAEAIQGGCDDWTLRGTTIRYNSR